MESSELESKKCGKQKFGDRDTVGHTLLDLWLFPHGVLRGAGERSEEEFVPDSLQETRRARRGGGEGMAGRQGSSFRNLTNFPPRDGTSPCPESQCRGTIDLLLPDQL